MMKYEKPILHDFFPGDVTGIGNCNPNGSTASPSCGTGTHVNPNCSFGDSASDGNCADGDYAGGCGTGYQPRSGGCGSCVSDSSNCSLGSYFGGTCSNGDYAGSTCSTGWAPGGDGCKDGSTT